MIDDKKLPVNPIQEMMTGMPALPSIIQNAMPVTLPQMQYEQNPVSMVFGNFKRARLAKATSIEAEIAENSNKALRAKLDSINAVVTFSSRVEHDLAEYHHKKTMFVLEEDKARAEVIKIQAEANIACWEARITELEYKMKEKHFEESDDD